MIVRTDQGEQGSAAWRQARAGSITGTGFGKALKFLKNGKPSQERTDYRLQLVVERLTGEPAPELLRVAALDWGKGHEGEARTAYEMQMDKLGKPVFVECVPFQQHPTLDWVGTSPDGFVGEDGMIEIKCPYNSGEHLITIINASAALASALIGDASLVIMPGEYVPQVQGNLWVTGRQWCDYISYDPRMPPHLQLYVSRTPRDEAYITALEKGVLLMLDEIESNITLLLDPQEDAFPPPIPQPVVVPAGVPA